MKTTKKSLLERIAEKRKNLKMGSGNFKFFMPKEGVTRYRVLSTGEENDFSMEVTTFYLGKDLGFVISPRTFGEKCAIMKTYDKLSTSKNEDDKQFAAKFKPGKKFLVGAIRYTDEKGKEVDTESGVKLLMLPTGLYGHLLDLYLDVDEAGDFTHPTEGYDIKILRTGKGKMDTEYNLTKCKNTKIASEFKKPIDLEKMVKEVTPSYEETSELIEKFLNLPDSTEDEQNSDKKEKRKDKKKKKKNKDL